MEVLFTQLYTAQ